jgi:hypothetical protein
MPSSKPIPGVNDLQSQFPEIAKEWHPINNGILKPLDVSKASRKKVWWQCRKHPAHEWETQIKHRTISGSGCPICIGLKVLEGFNDLKTSDPKIAMEWHPIRNENLKPTEVSRSSSKKVWWQCSKCSDHEWVSRIADRTSGTDCPICHGLKVLVGFNDLQSSAPEISKEWHPTKNGDFKPTEVTKNSNKIVWWQCSKHPEHEWHTRVADRGFRGSSCPICIGQQALEGFNDLNTTDPKIAKEWHPTKNEELKPTEVTRSSSKRVWWQCSEHPSHEWNSLISNRTNNGTCCPICIGQQVLEGFNDLNTTDPKIAKEWHPTKNEELKSTEVTRSSQKKVWWQCSKNATHEWDAVIGSRTIGAGCPACAEYGFNPLKNAWFYLMEKPGEQQFGITNELDVRMNAHRRNGWILLETTKPALGSKVQATEAEFKKWLKKEIGLMEGTTENWSTTSMEVQSLAELKARSGIETDLF